MPCRIPAASMASSGSDVKLRPLGSMVMVNVILIEESEVRAAVVLHDKRTLALSPICKFRRGMLVWACWVLCPRDFGASGC